MKKGIGIMIVLALLLTSCSILGNKAEPAVDPAIAAMQSTLAVQQAVATFSAQTQAAQAQPTEEVAAAEPTATLTTEPPAAAEALRASANINVNCRMGPAANFPLVVSLKAGDTVEVIGKNTDNGPYWKVKTENGKECWLTGGAVSLSGSADAVAMLVAPPTPTPAPPPNWAGNWKILFSNQPNDPEGTASVLNVTFTQSGNALSSSFTSGNGNAILINGTVSADGLTASGSLIFGPTSLTFYLIRNPDNVNQFRGKFWNPAMTGLDGVFCGGTQGLSYPSPCRP